MITLEKASKKSTEETYPKYWCHYESYGIGYVVRTYAEIWNAEQLKKVEERRSKLPDGWKGFITTSFCEASLYEND